jgi:hypothetical protein
VSVVTAGCLVWLERLQPVFAALMVCTLAYESWLVWRRPPHRRTRAMLAILWTSIAVCVLMVLTWTGLWLRYR